MRNNRLVVSVVIGIIVAGSLAAQSAPGGEPLSPYLLSGPGSLAYGAGLSTQDAPFVSPRNPALDAALSRVSLGLYATGLFGVRDASGAGVVTGIGSSLPTDRGVFTGTVDLIALSDALPYASAGWHSRTRLAFSKALYPDLFAGAALNAELGRGDQPDWGASVDLGVYHRLGDWFVLRDIWWDAGLHGLGKGFFWTDAGTYAPEMPTPRLGFGTRLLEIDRAELDFSLDLSFPRFGNVRLLADLDLLVDPGITAGLGYSFDLRRAQDGTGSLPLQFSVGYRFTPPYDEVDVTVAEGPGTYAGLPREGGHADLFVNPAHRDLLAVGASAAIPVDRRERRPIEITLHTDEEEYFSPSDGNPGDVFEVRFDVTSRYRIIEYRFVIEDETGVPIRTMRARAEAGVPPFEVEEPTLVERLLGRRTGLELPESFVWDGLDEEGELVADGEYHYYLEVTDETRRVARSVRRTIVVDTVAPVVQVSAAYTAFSPDGEGARNTLPIEQSGSVEDLWKGTFLDAERRPVRTFVWESGEPGDFAWDGRDDEGELAPDGRYDYEISATDRAGNTTVERLAGLTLNTEEYDVALVPEIRYFSPGTDAPTDEVVFSLEAEAPESVVTWDFVVRDVQQRIVMQLHGAAPLPPTLSFGGRDRDGVVLPEGPYRAELSVHYDHGKSAYAESEPVVLDVTAPQASVRPEYRVFSPVGDGRRDTVTFFNETSEEPEWTIRIEDEDGTPVRSERYADRAPARFVWDATDDQGRPVPDGIYAYVLEAVDEAGNLGRSNVVEVEVDTRPTPVTLTTDLRYFSPTDSGIQDTIRIEPAVEIPEGITRSALRILDEEETAVVRRERARTAPAPFVWNGRDDDGLRVDDGAYVAEIEILYEKGDLVVERTEPFRIDTVPPDARIEPEFRHLAPGEPTGRMQVRIVQDTSEEDLWEGTIFDEQARPVRRYEWPGVAPDLVWDGRDDDGNIVSDGTYSYQLYSRDRAGNERLVTVDDLVVDTRPVTASARREPEGFAPTGDGFMDLVVFTLDAHPRDSVSEWTLGISGAGGVTVRSWSGTGAPPREVVWDGRMASPTAPEGLYVGELEVRYLNAKVARASTEEFRLDVSPPDLSLDAGPFPFAPDGDGVRDELTIDLEAHDESELAAWELRIFDPTGVEFISWDGEGAPPESIVWDGYSRTGELVQSAVDYEIVYAASDVLRNRAETRMDLPTDILVIRDNDLLRIRIASITFAPNTADFINVAEDRRQQNLQTLDRLAEKLQRYSGYQITVEGHANMVYWFDEERGRREHEQVLLPLSEARAEAIRDALVTRGIPRARMETRGVGGDDPVEPFSDTVNRWKNRRVEFILEDR